VALLAWYLHGGEPLPAWVEHGPLLPIAGALALAGLAYDIARRLGHRHRG
jgi:hypothetical protein